MNEEHDMAGVRAMAEAGDRIAGQLLEQLGTLIDGEVEASPILKENGGARAIGVGVSAIQAMAASVLINAAESNDKAVMALCVGMLGESLTPLIAAVEKKLEEGE